MRQYLLVTGNYRAFTLTDGVAHAGGAALLSVGLFAPADRHADSHFYETVGVMTNLLGGYLGARLSIGLGLQVASLQMLTVPAVWRCLASCLRSTPHCTAT